MISEFHVAILMPPVQSCPDGSGRRQTLRGRWCCQTHLPKPRPDILNACLTDNVRHPRAAVGAMRVKILRAAGPKWHEKPLLPAEPSVLDQQVSNRSVKPPTCLTRFPTGSASSTFGLKL